MSPTQLIYQTLAADAAVVALVAGRVFPLRIPQNTPLPAVAYQLVSQTPRPLHACNLPDQALVQVTVYAKRYADVETISDAIRAALGSYENGETFIEYDNSRDLHDDVAGTYYRPVDFRVEIPVGQPVIVPPEPLPPGVLGGPLPLILS